MCCVYFPDTRIRVNAQCRGVLVTVMGLGGDVSPTFNVAVHDLKGSKCTHTLDCEI